MEVKLDSVDTFCIKRDFEEWALLAPALLISKDGDGNYEWEITQKFFACFEAAYKKGAWRINLQTLDDLIKAEAARKELAESIEYYFSVLDEVRGGEWREKPDHVLAKMLAALAKAKGETPCP